MTVTGKLIKSSRVRRNLAQAEIASVLNCAPAFISRVETGKSPLPKLHVAKLAKILKIDESDLKWAMSEDYRSNLEPKK